MSSSSSVPSTTEPHGASPKANRRDRAARREPEGEPKRPSSVAAPYTPIVGTLVYIWDRDTDRVLLVHRNARADDEHLGKYNGLGGKLEADEDVVSSCRREAHEEAGLELTELTLRGTVSWPGFGPNGEDWLGFIFRAHRWAGEPHTTNEEGTLHWVARSRLLAACSDDPAERSRADLPSWAGDRWFVPLVFDDDPRAFHGIMPYEQGEPVSWSVERL
ncbi:MAG: 8-oxo-dGTP diphosphatase [Actinomycetia bacterium]|nr:8-oxo-dGTP diphosphatase [Actinomycetes bacterium]